MQTYRYTINMVDVSADETLNEIAQLFREGKLPKETLLCETGKKSWIGIEEVLKEKEAELNQPAQVNGNGSHNSIPYETPPNLNSPSDRLSYQESLLGIQRRQAAAAAAAKSLVNQDSSSSLIDPPMPQNQNEASTPSSDLPLSSGNRKKRLALDKVVEATNQFTSSPLESPPQSRVPISSSNNLLDDFFQDEASIPQASPRQIPAQIEQPPVSEAEPFIEEISKPESETLESSSVPEYPAESVIGRSESQTDHYKAQNIQELFVRVEQFKSENTCVDILQYDHLDASSDLETALAIHEMEQIGLRPKQARIVLNQSDILVEPGSVQFMKGKISEKEERSISSNQTFDAKESLEVETTKSRLTGSGEVYFTPSFYHYMILKMDQEEIALEQANFLASEGSLKLKVVLQKAESHQVLSNWFQTFISGTGWLLISSPVPDREIIQCKLKDEILITDSNLVLLRKGKFEVISNIESHHSIGLTTDGRKKGFKGTGEIWLLPSKYIHNSIDKQKHYLLRKKE
jgi:uncharacterized protein (AIM24 family)